MPVFFFGALIGLIATVFFRVADVVLRVVRAIIPIVDKVFGVIKTVVVRVGQNAGRFFRFIARSARALYRDILVPLTDALKRFIDKIEAFLRRVFDPIIKIFDRIREVLNKIWDKIIRPVLDAIDKIRVALRLLAKLGVPFVAAIEKVLQAIQREIFERFVQVQNWVNQATFWLDLLLDPRGWIKSTPFLYTIYRYAGNVLNIVTKLADLDGRNVESIRQHIEENRATGLSPIVVRVKSGEIRKSFAVQNAAARFRSRSTGKVL